MIPVDDQRVPVQRGRTPFTVVTPRRHLAQVPAPDPFALNVITMHPTRPVINVEMLPVSHRRRGSVAVIAVVPFMRQLFTNGFTPEKLAGLPVDAQDIKAVNDLRLRVGHGRQGRSALNFDTCLSNGFRAGLFADGLGQKQKQTVIPDNGRGTAATGNLDLPLDILGGTPFDGRLAIGHSAIGIGPAPSGPLVGGLKAWAQKHQARDNEKQNSHEWSGQEDN